MLNGRKQYNDNNQIEEEMKIIKSYVLVTENVYLENYKRRSYVSYKINSRSY